MWRSEDNLVELVLSLHLVDPRDQTPVVNVRDRPLYQPGGATFVCSSRCDQPYGLSWAAAGLLGSVPCGHHLAPLPGDYFI